MALKIRLRQQGKKNQPVFRLVLSNSRSPRDGKYIENLGWYNPRGKDAATTCNLQAERVLYWLNQGAILSETAENLVRRAAPQVMENFYKKQQDARMKACQKKRQARKKAAAAA